MDLKSYAQMTMKYKHPHTACHTSPHALIPVNLRSAELYEEYE